MKNLITLLVIVMAANISFAQECKKTCKKDSYVLNDNLIEATLFHDNGVIAQKGYYTQENKLHGNWTSYDINGNKTAEAKYFNGEKTGTWYFYQGDKIREVTYSNSKIAKVKTWSADDTRVVSYR